MPFAKCLQTRKKKQPVNRALFESWSVSLSQLSEPEIKKLKNKKQDIIDKFINYVDNNKEFRESISQVSEKVEYRFKTIEKIIQEVLS